VGFPVGRSSLAKRLTSADSVARCGAASQVLQWAGKSCKFIKTRHHRPDAVEYDLRL